MEGTLKALANISLTRSKTNKIDNEFSRNLIMDLNEVTEQLKDLSVKYNMINDSDLIESLIYEELALKSKYSYLLKLAKSNNVHYEGNYISGR